MCGLLLEVVTQSYSSVQRKLSAIGPNIEEKGGFVLSKANLPSYISIYTVYICIKTHFSVFSID